MSERGRYDRSRYGSGGKTSDAPDNTSGRYHDYFFDDMRIPEAEPGQSRGSRLDALDNGVEKGRRGFHVSRDEADEAPLAQDGSAAESADAEEGGAAFEEASEPGRRARHGRFWSQAEPEGSAASDDGEEGAQADPSEATASMPEHTRRSTRDFSRAAVERDLASGIPQKKRSRRRILTAVAVAVVAVLLVGAGAAFAYVNGIAKNLQSGLDQNLRDALVETDMANEPFYMLLLGTDGSAVRDEDPEFGGQYRSDSMMLARIDPVKKKVTLISVSRDIVVDLGEYGEEKINAAYAFGGAALSVEAVSKLAGVPISHYAQVDFDGFEAMVDALGGIEVDVPMYIDDVDAGGVVEAGEHTLTGAEALILCRARNAYADLSAHPDAMRAANQRLVLSAIAKKALSADVATIAATVQAMSRYVTTDLGINDIIGLAQVMRGLSPDTDVYTASVPTTSEYVDGGWYEFIDKKAWATMMDRVKAGEPPTEEAVVDEATGTVLATSGAGTTNSAEKYATVTVKNGTETSGLAAKVRSTLLDAGFVNVMVGDVAPGYDYPDTLVIYDDAARAREAAEIVAAIGQGQAMLNDGSYLLLDTDFIVLIGENWES